MNCFCFSNKKKTRQRLEKMEAHIRAIGQLTQLRTDLKQKKARTEKEGAKHLRQMTGLKQQFDDYKRQLVIMVDSKYLLYTYECWI